MRDLLRALEEGRTIHVAVRELPDALRAAPKAVGYGAKDVGVTPQDAVTPNAYAGEGQKGFVVIVNLETGKRETLGGDWGGGGMSLKPIDAASQDVRIPPNGAVIIGTEGYPRVMASIYVHPDGIAKLLPPTAAVTDREQTILRTIRSLTSAGRKEVFGRERVTPAEIDALVARGLLKKTKAGAVSITTDGKNVAEGQEDGMRELLDRLEESALEAALLAMSEDEADAFAEDLDEALSGAEKREIKHDEKARAQSMEPYRAAAKAVNVKSMSKYSTKELMAMLKGSRTGGKEGISSGESNRQVALRILRQRMSRGKRGIRKQSMF